MSDDKFIYLEDVRVGQRFSAGPVEITAAEIIEFGKKYDPQDFHTDPERAKNTVFGELIASGWQTACITMRMVVDAMPKMKGGMVGRGVEKLSWMRAVKPGDRLSYEAEIIDVRNSNSNPERGIIRVKNTTYNQNREPVLEMETVVFMPRRTKG